MIYRLHYKEASASFLWAADSADWVDAAAVRNKRERLNELFARCGDTLDFRCGTDQVGTLKLLTDARGDVIKEVEYDSFSVKLYDSMPDIFIPVGFAGGLEDPHAGLARFGYRDYDPSVGRFSIQALAKLVLTNAPALYKVIFLCISI